MSEIDHVGDPLTPAHAKSQVIDAAREVIALLGIRATQAWVSLESCNDQGEAPFRGRAAVHYPTAPTPELAQHDTEQFLRQLREAGWNPNPDFTSAAPNLEKSGVTIILEPQGVGDSVRVVTALGQCRDVTTTKHTRGTVEPFPLG